MTTRHNKSFTHGQDITFQQSTLYAQFVVVVDSEPETKEHDKETAKNGICANNGNTITKAEGPGREKADENVSSKSYSLALISANIDSIYGLVKCQCKLLAPEPPKIFHVIRFKTKT